MGYKEQIACRSAFLTLPGISYVLQPPLKNSQKEEKEVETAKPPLNVDTNSFDR